MVHGERIMVFSGEYHPFRLPVPGLWLDVFQKIKSLGFSAVSFYVDWALLEGEPGVYNASGIFALEPFFEEAASQAGIYLIARPGPVSRQFMNSELLLKFHSTSMLKQAVVDFRVGFRQLRCECWSYYCQISDYKRRPNNSSPA
jgi:beta-galactosidase GanA